MITFRSKNAGLLVVNWVMLLTKQGQIPQALVIIKVLKNVHVLNKLTHGLAYYSLSNPLLVRFLLRLSRLAQLQST